jgi:hypothetical protein
MFQLQRLPNVKIDEMMMKVGKGFGVCHSLFKVLSQHAPGETE